MFPRVPVRGLPVSAHSACASGSWSMAVGVGVSAHLSAPVHPLSSRQPLCAHTGVSAHLSVSVCVPLCLHSGLCAWAGGLRVPLCLHPGCVHAQVACVCASHVCIGLCACAGGLYMHPCLHPRLRACAGGLCVPLCLHPVCVHAQVVCMCTHVCTPACGLCSSAGLPSPGHSHFSRSGLACRPRLACPEGRDHRPGVRAGCGWSGGRRAPGNQDSPVVRGGRGGREVPVLLGGLEAPGKSLG